MTNYNLSEGQSAANRMMFIMGYDPGRTSIENIQYVLEQNQKYIRYH